MGCGASASGRYAYIVSAASDKTARVWDAHTGKEVMRIDHTGYVLSAEMYITGTAEKGEWRLVTASADGTARIWRARAAKMPLVAREAGVEQKNLDVCLMDDCPRGVELQRFSHEGSQVWTAVVDSSCRYVVTAGHDGTVRVWNIRDGTEICRAKHDDSVNCANVSFDNKAKCLVIASASDDRTGRLWTGIEKGQLVEAMRVNHEAGVICASLEATACRFATSSFDGTAKLWDRQTKAQLVSVCHDASKACPIRSVQEFKMGKRQFLLTAADDQTVRIWDGVAGSELHRLDLQAAVTSAVHAPLGSSALQVLTTCADGQVALWQHAAVGKDHNKSLLGEDWQQVLEMKHECSAQTAFLYTTASPW
eukprot:TRINITY_DN75652_c0_g1_i1.p1 TRINITY_DN75652_c0_g1~~TRINITY_DN75652_c0_g1_i1.p1  ORF type:complete len:365 (-),score=83.22 TRINITY_DN75652_c0_g1_i1:845-1939(-)